MLEIIFGLILFCIGVLGMNYFIPMVETFKETYQWGILVIGYIGMAISLSLFVGGFVIMFAGLVVPNVFKY